MLGVELIGRTLTVDLSAEAYADLVSPVLAQRARDQLIYTAAEVVGDPELRVKFLRDGSRPSADFESPDGFARTGLDPLPALWVSSPRNAASLPAGQTVIVGTVKPDVGEPIVTITNLASGAVVAEVSAQTSTGVNEEGWRVWSVSVALEKGDYDITAVVTTGTPPVTSSENKSITVN